jgi:glycerol-3-phosphate acyltransferase PlsX
MTRPPRIVLDAMGGDAGVLSVVQGASRITTSKSPFPIALVGDPGEIQAALSKTSYSEEWIEIVPSSGAIPMHAKPREAMERQPDCSICVAADLVGQGEGAALVSAGHTGATILAASQRFTLLEGIRRTALAAVYPTRLPHGPRGDPFALMLDVGATLEARATDLIGFAALGTAYARVISSNPNPKVALLSNGSEPGKGLSAIVEAHQLLQEQSALNFIGNVEGNDIARGTADVIVSPGFLGNIVLKTLEGISEVASDLARDAYARKLVWKLGLSMVSRELRALRRITDWKYYGGAPLLGFDQVVIKAHGRSNARAIRNALKVAQKAVIGDIAGQVRGAMSQINSDPEAPE